MSNELLTMSTQSALDLSRIHNAALLKETQSLDNLVSQLRNKASSLIIDAESIRREQAIILDRIQSTKLYEKDGFKSLAEYGDTIGIGKSTTYALSRVGHVYNDKKAPDAIKALSPSNLDTLTAAIKTNQKQVYKDAELGAFDGASQSTLKDYAKTIKPAKTVVVKTYQAFILANPGYWEETPVTMDDESHPTSDYIESEWCDYLTSNGSAIYKVQIKGRKIWLVIEQDGEYQMVELREYNPKSNGVPKTINPRDEFIAKSRDAGTPLETVDSIISMMSWVPLTDAERNSYNQ